MKKINGMKDQTIDSPEESLDLYGCCNIIIKNPNISGGKHNICFTNCNNCKIISGKLNEPESNVNDPEDPENHNILFDKCCNCFVKGTECNGKIPRGDAINFYNSKFCSALQCIITGPLAKFSTAVILDGPNGKNNIIEGIIINSKNGRIGICGGSGHKIKDCILNGALEITGEYYKNTIVRDVKLINITGPEIYVNKETVINLIMKNCKFKNVN